MARVFVSYRRADGVYGVGWLAERLRSLDSITGVETAFHDAALRAGDDFPDALDTEIAGSDLVVAVIGPAWRGDRPDGPARIEDADDWVVREIASAFAQGTTVVPVLMGDVDHPLASEVHPSIAELSRLHALPFVDGRDLDTIVEHIESHLAEIDRERARLAGLEEPVEVPVLDHLGALITSAAVAGVIGGVVGAATSGVVPLWPFDDVPQSAPISGTGAYVWWQALMIVLGIGSGAFFVFGVVLARRLTRYVSINWVRFGVVFALVVGVATILVASSQIREIRRADPELIALLELRLIVSAAVTLLAVAPWTVCLTAPLNSTPRADEWQVGRRLQSLALLRDAERWAAVSIAALLTMSTAVGAALVGAALEADSLEVFESIPNIGFAAMESALLMLAHIAAITRLRDRQVALERSLADLPPRYRANALPRLVATAFDDGGWGFRVLLALPVIVAIVAAGGIALAVD